MTATHIEIRHVPNAVTAAFIVVRVPAGAQTSPITIPSPGKFRLKERAKSTLLQELAWYLERFLEYPFDPEQEHASQVQGGLKEWGASASKALFEPRHFGQWPSELESIQIRSNDPHVLSWPWEALADPQGRPIGLDYKVSRFLDVAQSRTSQLLLSKKCLNILAVVARPFVGDVHFGAILRPLIELSRSDRIPVKIDLLRPPTFDQLARHLRERPSYYHVLHFDGHGGYGSSNGTDSERGIRIGHLLFENEVGEPDSRAASEISAVLKELPVPLIVLNACQSAAIDSYARDAFASVTTALLDVGVGSVVAMAHSLYVTAAQVFIPAFYNAFFQHGVVGEAVSIGRQELFRNKRRFCAWGMHDLDDWLVPVLYEDKAFDFGFVFTESYRSRESSLPPAVLTHDQPSVFVGRDEFFQQLERWLQGPTTAILIHGLRGAGKSELAREFLGWLEATGWVGDVFWEDYSSISSSSELKHRLNMILDGGDTVTTDTAAKSVGALAIARTKLLVIDGFESAEIDTDVVHGKLEDQLSAIIGEQVKVLITSRSEINLGAVPCLKMAISGLRKEEQWQYVEAIFKANNVELLDNTAEVTKLLDELSGHPMGMQAVLPELKRLSASEILHNGMSRLELNYDGARGLRLLDVQELNSGVSDDLKLTLELIGLHSQCFLKMRLIFMATQVSPTVSDDFVNRLLSSFEKQGLIQASPPIYRMHPLLANYLRQRLGEGCAKAKHAFVEVMEREAAELTSFEFDTQRFFFDRLGRNLQQALTLADELSLQEHWWSLCQCLAAWSQKSGHTDESSQLWEAMAQRAKELGNVERLASSYHNLGIDKQLQGLFEEANECYEKSLTLRQQAGDPQKAAATYYQLGLISREIHDFEAARRHQRIAVELAKEYDDHHIQVRSFQELGNIAFDLGELTEARGYYLKGLSVINAEASVDQSDAASLYHELSMTTLQEQNYDESLEWALKCFEIRAKEGNESDLAINCHQLGSVLVERGDFEGARQFFLKSIEIKERLGDSNGAAYSYQGLGVVARRQQLYDEANGWFLKGLKIAELGNDARLIDSTGRNLGDIAGLQNQFKSACQWLIRSMVERRRIRRDPNIDGALHNFRVFFLRAGADDQEDLIGLWEESGLGDFPISKVDYALPIDRDDQDPDFYYRRAVARQAQEDYIGAEADLSIAIRLGLDSASVYHSRGLFRWFLRDRRGAEEDFTAAIERGRDDAEPYYWRGRARAANPDLKFGGAVDDLTAAIARGLDDADVFYQRAEIRAHLGDEAGAESDYSSAIERGRDDAAVYYYRGWARDSQRKDAGAEADYFAAIDRGMRDPDVFFALGCIHDRQGQFRAAEDDFTSAIENSGWGGSPEHYLYLRGRARHAQRDFRGAEEDYLAAIQAGEEGVQSLLEVARRNQDLPSEL